MNDPSIRQRLAARISAAHHILAVKAEESIYDAVRRLGLTGVLDRLPMVRAAALNHSPLYVDQCLITGSTCRDMYDDNPGVAYFYTAGSLSADLTPYRHLADAQQQAIELWVAERRDSEGFGEEWDGKFIVGTTIILNDQFGRPIDEYDGEGNRWAVIEPESRWAEMLEEAAALRSEAHRESGWDNFSTAADLRRRADKLERSVQIAKLRPRVII